MPQQRITQRRQQATERGGAVVLVAFILVGFLTSISLLLIALGVANRAILSVFHTLWRLSPVLAVVFAASGCLFVSTILTYAGGTFWQNRQVVTRYWLSLLRRRPIQFGPAELESDDPPQQGNSRAVLMGTGGLAVLATILALLAMLFTVNAVGAPIDTPIAASLRTLAPTATATTAPTTTATTAPTLPSTGKPFIGGPFANFPAKFGQPFGHGVGDSDNFWADSAHTIVIDVSPTSGIVTYINVIGSESWSDDQTFAYCIQFLPDGATEYNRLNENTDYHSSVGDLVVSNFGIGHV